MKIYDIAEYIRYSTETETGTHIHTHTERGLGRLLLCCFEGSTQRADMGLVTR